MRYWAALFKKMVKVGRRYFSNSNSNINIGKQKHTSLYSNYIEVEGVLWI